MQATETGLTLLTALGKVVDPAGKALVLFRAGGAARAIAVEAALAGGVSITVVNRDPKRGAGTRRLDFPNVEARLDLDADSLRPSMVVADVIPNPPRTPLIRDAEARGCILLDGLGMLVNQGVITRPRAALRCASSGRGVGIDADPTVMRQKLEDLFSF